MIQEAVIVMTVLGCGNDVQSCDYVITPDKTWETVAACDAAIPSQLQRLDSDNYPVLTANCEVQKPVTVVKYEENVAVVDQTEPVEETVFDQLRAKADATDVDILGKAKISFESLAKAPKKLVAKIKTVFVTE